MRMKGKVRPLSAALALVGAALFLCACGGSKDSSSSASGGAPTKAQALAYANAVNLKPADLPGFTASTPEAAGSSGKRVDAEVASCAQAGSADSAIAEVPSDQFELERGVEHQLASSEVTVLPTPALAAKELAAINSPHSKECIVRYLQVALERRVHTSVTIEEVKSVPRPVTAPGTSNSFGLRLTMTVTGGGAQFPLTLDILGFTVGPAGVTLSVGGLPQQFPPEMEQHLFSELVSRATSHSL